MRTAIYSGAFDPFTVAHKAIVEKILDDGLADKVLIVPSVVECHRDGKERWLSNEERLMAISAIMADRLGGKVGIDLTDYSAVRRRNGEPAAEATARGRRYIHTLTDLVSARFGGKYDDLITVIGSDSLRDFKSWFEWEEILKFSRLLVVQGRDGETVESDIPHDDVSIAPEFASVSATAVREKYRTLGLERYIRDTTGHRFDYLSEMKLYGYGFCPLTAYEIIADRWREWAKSVGAEKWVLGVSGGKDSTVVAYLAARIFGPENVYGVMMPCREQKDIADSLRVCELTGIHAKTVNIGDAFGSIITQIDAPSETAKTNLPPRLRMAALYAVAQSVGGFVLNTCNLSEDTLGYSTLWGDSVGSFSPLQGLTVTEIISLGSWLGIPEDLICKTPADGLQDKTDEDNLGVKYADVDCLIRRGMADTPTMCRVKDLYARNRFKQQLIRLPGPRFDFLPNHVAGIAK